MARSHVTVALSDSTSDGQVTVLTVHVVCTRTRVITQPDAEILDLLRCALVLALDRDNLTGCLLEFAQLAEEIPEARLGDDVVWRKDDHLEEWRIFLLLRWQLAADDLVFLELKREGASVSEEFDGKERSSGRLEMEFCDF